MIASIFENIVTWALHLINTLGYTGLFIAMFLESAAIPIPSEVVVPFGGFLASSGRLDFWVVVLVATLANLAGSLLLYSIGYYGGQTFLHRYGKYILMHRDDIEKMDRWLQHYGGRVAFFSRLIPGTRTFSSLVIGAGDVNLKTFFWYTLFGSFTWNLPWTYAGYVAGSRWQEFQPYVRRFDYLILGIILAAIAIFIIRHIKKLSRK